MLLLQSAGPLIIIVWAFALFGERPTLWQSAGVLLSLIGVATIAAHGSLETLLHLSLNQRRRVDPGGDGDLRHLCGDVPRPSRRASAEFPGGHDGTRFADDPAILSLGDRAGRPHHRRPSAWLAMGYIAVFPSFIAYLFFNRGIELIGAARAGQSWHLMPVFGSILAVLFLGETFYLYHAVGIALIAGGIVLASIRVISRRAIATELEEGVRAPTLDCVAHPPELWRMPRWHRGAIFALLLTAASTQAGEELPSRSSPPASWYHRKS